MDKLILIVNRSKKIKQNLINEDIKAQFHCEIIKKKDTSLVVILNSNVKYPIVVCYENLKLDQIYFVPISRVNHFYNYTVTNQTLPSPCGLCYQCSSLSLP